MSTCAKTVKSKLLVPVKLQALVIEDQVIETATPTKEGGFLTQGDGRWIPPSEITLNYSQVTDNLNSPGPELFFGQTEQNSQWYSDADWANPTSSAQKYRGIYLHWVLPPMLRHSYQSKTSIEYPPIPNQWLIVRFVRCTDNDALNKTESWFLDGNAQTDTTDGASLMIPNTGNSPSQSYYTAKRYGKFYKTSDYEKNDDTATRTTINAIGNHETSAVQFTAFLANNRNVLSFHDDLSDLRTDPASGNYELTDTNIGVTYLAVGWYHDSADDPFTYLNKLQNLTTSEEISDYLQWSILSKPKTVEVEQCVFHGMTAHINYWNQDNYKGQMLGYPGSPFLHGEYSKGENPINVGLGNSASDALISIISGLKGSGLTGNSQSIVKALEDAIYRKTTAMLNGFDQAPSPYKVRQDWYNAHPGGRVWDIVPTGENTDNDNPDASQMDFPQVPQITIQMTTLLNELNTHQNIFDEKARKIAANNQEYYAGFWYYIQQTLAAGGAVTPNSHFNTVSKNIKNERINLANSLKKISELMTQLNTLLTPQKESGSNTESSKNSGTTTTKSDLKPILRLKSVPGPRFWSPADPVILLNNIGNQKKYDFPTPLPCRFSDNTVDQATISGKTTTKNEKKDKLIDVSAEQTFITSYFPDLANSVTGLLTEAALIEQTLSDVVSINPVPDGGFSTLSKWQTWEKKIKDYLTPDSQSSGSGKTSDKVSFTTKEKNTIADPRVLAQFWGKQPWSPLYLDWQISWYPMKEDSGNFSKYWNFKGYGYEPIQETDDFVSGLPKKVVKGRSLVSGFSTEFFSEALQELSDILSGKEKITDKETSKTEKLLKTLNEDWGQTLTELEETGFMGQTLTGFIQSLMLNRNSLLPRVQPSPNYPWWNVTNDKKALELLVPPVFSYETSGSGKNQDKTVRNNMTFYLHNLAPPDMTPQTNAPEFGLTKGGVYKIDHLRMVDDFGQWVDLLESSSREATAVYVNANTAWKAGGKSNTECPYITFSPRIAQPSRLSFRFTEDPVCGWVFYNYVDQSLVICDANGCLLGELTLVIGTSNKYSVKWECFSGVRLGFCMDFPL